MTSTFITNSRTLEQIIDRTTRRILKDATRQRIKLLVGFAVRRAVFLTRTGKVPTDIYTPRLRIRNRRTASARGRVRGRAR